MRHILTYISAVTSAMLLSGCTGVMTSVGEGVAWPLAQSRRQSVSDIRYDLHFRIPESKSDPIRGHETLSVKLSSASDLVLDFREDGVDSLCVGGALLERGRQWKWENEHIVISSKVLSEGENTIWMSFTPSDQSFNRNDEYLYTLVVPERSRTIYPCFDQPDMKAEFSLTLDMPEEWTAVSAGPVVSESVSSGRKTVRFGAMPPVSTYLFSFVAGVWKTASYTDSSRTYNAFYRETDPAKIAQLDDIFQQVSKSVTWLEEYTGIDFPWPKYDFVIIPGFQYGGMEHIGATQYNESTIFLGPNPTPDERYKRIELIAHETSHMWFGDLVTMAWFDDVWTKEVFASYFAQQIAQPLFPEVDHSLNWLKSLTAPALSEDRTRGTTSIQQELPNLSSAGLVYNNIIYDKAPVMMSKLVALMGKDAFREGIREYLSTFSYSNATWDDLVAILDSKTDADIRSFSEVWVHEKGMPDITVTKDSDRLVISQSDPFGRGLLWPQSFEVTVLPDERVIPVTLTGTDASWSMEIPSLKDKVILVGTDGNAYGRVLPDSSDLEWMLDSWQERTVPVQRQFLLMTLWENYLAGRISRDRAAYALLSSLEKERDNFTASTIIGYVPTVLRDMAFSGSDTEDLERRFMAIGSSHALASVRQQVTRSMFSLVTAPDILDSLYSIWDGETMSGLSESDYMSFSYELAVRMPQKGADIIARQRSRLDGSDPKRQFNPDRLRQFDFVSRGALPCGPELDEVFGTLLEPQGRRMEPWSASLIRLLMHPERGDYSLKYLPRALEELQQVQRTGDIFFPGNWCKAFLTECRSASAKAVVDEFLSSHPDYPQLLRNKILLASYNLDRFNPSN